MLAFPSKIKDWIRKALQDNVHDDEASKKNIFPC